MERPRCIKLSGKRSFVHQGVSSVCLRVYSCFTTGGILLQNPRILGEYSIFQGRPFKNVRRIKDLLPPLGFKRPPWLHAS